MPLVSIVIINYNTFNLTCQCIQSVYNQTTGLLYEIILVDNASVECNPELFSKKFPAVKLVKSEINLGFSGGNNLGLRHVKGEIVLLLNSDTVLMNNAIKITYDQLIADKRIGVITGKLIYPDGSIQYQCGRFPSIKLQLIELFRIQKLWSAKKRGQILMGGFFDHQSELEPDWVWGTFFMTKRTIIRKLPDQKLPDDFFMYAEDLQWCYLFRKLGLTVKYMPQAVIMHHFSGSIKSDKQAKHYDLISSNLDVFLKKYYGSILTRILYLLKALTYLSLIFNNKECIHLYNRYIRLIFNRIDTITYEKDIK